MGCHLGEDMGQNKRILLTNQSRPNQRGSSRFHRCSLPNPFDQQGKTNSDLIRTHRRAEKEMDYDMRIGPVQRKQANYQRLWPHTQTLLLPSRRF